MLAGVERDGNDGRDSVGGDISTPLVVGLVVVPMAALVFVLGLLCQGGNDGENEVDGSLIGRVISDDDEKNGEVQSQHSRSGDGPSPWRSPRVVVAWWSP